MRRRTGLKGQATVEFALLLPIMLAMLAGAVDVGNIARANSIAQAASSEGARIVASESITSSTEIREYLNRAFPLGDSAEIKVETEMLAPKGVTMRVEDKTANANYARTSVEVRVTMSVPTVLPLGLIGLPGDANRVETSAAKTAVASRLQASSSGQTSDVIHDTHSTTGMSGLYYEFTIPEDNRATFSFEWPDGITQDRLVDVNFRRRDASGAWEFYSPQRSGNDHIFTEGGEYAANFEISPELRDPVEIPITITIPRMRSAKAGGDI